MFLKRRCARQVSLIDLFQRTELFLDASHSNVCWKTTGPFNSIIRSVNSLPVRPIGISSNGNCVAVTVLSNHVRYADFRDNACGGIQIKWQGIFFLACDASQKFFFRFQLQGSSTSTFRSFSLTLSTRDPGAKRPLGALPSRPKGGKSPASQRRSLHRIHSGATEILKAWRSHERLGQYQEAKMFNVAWCAGPLGLGRCWPIGKPKAGGGCRGDG